MLYRVWTLLFKKWFIIMNKSVLMNDWKFLIVISEMLSKVRSSRQLATIKLRFMKQIIYNTIPRISSALTATYFVVGWIDFGAFLIKIYYVQARKFKLKYTDFFRFVFPQVLETLLFPFLTHCWSPYQFIYSQFIILIKTT